MKISCLAHAKAEQVLALLFLQSGARFDKIMLVVKEISETSWKHSCLT